MSDSDESIPSEGAAADEQEAAQVTENIEASPAETAEEEFDAPVRTQPEDSETDPDALIVRLEEYEGPMDVLLDLARRQKVDLVKISVLTLVEQYLAFIEEAKARKLEIAADYLVMASWLTYLKSKMLLPKVEEQGEEPTADEMAAQLAFQLQRLEAMRAAADKIMELPQRGQHFFMRGMPEGVRVTRKTEWTAEMFDLLEAYATQRVKAVDATIKYTPPKVYLIEEARERLSRILGAIPDWAELTALSPIDEVDAPRESVIASAFNAALEYAKAGKVEIRQTGAFAPLYLRSPAAMVEAAADPSHNTPSTRPGNELSS
jgi:segregation and condensation protein A